MINFKYMAKKLFWIFTLCLGVSCTSAFDIPAYDGYVTDTANILTEAQHQDLENQIFSFVTGTSAQLWVLIIPTTEWEDISMLAVEVGTKRGVGEKDFNNGIVIVIAIEDRKWFIAVWYGLEWTIPDAIAKRIGEAHFPEYFRAGDYAAWLQLALQDIYAYISNDPTAVHTYEASSSSSISWDNIDPGFIIVVFFLLASWLGRFITSPDPKDKKKRKMTKKGRIKYWIIWWIIALIAFGFWGALIRAMLLSYGWLWIIVALALSGMANGAGGKWWMFFMWGGGSSWWFSSGGSSFGGFSGGSFGGGGWGGSR